MTIRTRIVVTVVVLLAGALAVSGFIGLRASERALRVQVDDRLLEQFRTYMETHPPNATVPVGPAAAVATPQLPSEASFPDGKQFATFVLTRDGEILNVDPAGTREHPHALPRVRRGERPAARPDGKPPTIFTASATDASVRYRVMTSARPDGGLDVVAVSLERTDAALDHLRNVALLTGAITIILLGGLGALLVGRQLRPLAHVAQTAERIAAGDLSERVRVGTADDEVAAVGRSFNTMVDTLEASFAQQRLVEARLRQFIADASHELRTPLTTVQGYVELYAAGALPDEFARDRAMDRIGSETARMTDLVRQLLLIAQLDRELPLADIPVLVEVLVAEARDDVRAAYPHRSITVAGGPATVRGDAGALRQVVLNLVTNAVRYTPDDTPIELTITSQDGRVRIECRDHGPGIVRADRTRVFDRFYRTDKARSRDLGGAGLGLSIAASIVARHDGAISCEETPAGGATFVVLLPALTDGAGDAPGPRSSVGVAS